MKTRPIKVGFILILSCLSVLGGEAGIRVNTTTHSGSAGVVLKTDVFTRDGQTNLVRDISTKDGALISRIQKFYHDGLPVATSLEWVKPDFQDFIAEAGSPYSAEFTSRGTHTAGYVYINAKDGTLVDMFACTNGLYSPVESQKIREMNKERKFVERAVTEIQGAAPKGR